MEARSENSKASVTALSVASAFQRALHTKYNYLFSLNESELLNHICKFAIESFPKLSLNGLLANSIFISPYPMQTLFFNKVVAPYYEEYILLRKLLIKEIMQNAIRNGVKQIVFLGGGYDIRDFISSQEYPNVNFYELDRGITRETKLNAITTIPNALGYNVAINKVSSKATMLNKNLFYIECDFSTDDLSEVLTNYGFNKKEPTLIIGEGLTMYLSEEENSHTLRLANKLLDHPDSALLIGYGSKPIIESFLSDLAKQNSDEAYKFYLPIDKAISFAEQSEMGIVAKKAPINFLSEIGELEGMAYFQNKEDANTFEQYYLMKNKNFIIDNRNQIDDIPEIDIFIPNPPKPISTCFVM